MTRGFQQQKPPSYTVRRIARYQQNGARFVEPAPAPDPKAAERVDVKD